MIDVRIRSPQPGIISLKGLLPALIAVVPFIFNTPGLAEPQIGTMTLQVAVVEGNLRLTGEASTPEYTAYFHVPVPNRNQVPLRIDVSSNVLIDYRYIRTTGHNVLVAARMRSVPSAVLSWRAWVLVQGQFYHDLPVQPLMSSLSDLPDSVRPYLQTTATAQVETEPIQYWVERLSSIDYLDLVIDQVKGICYGIPFEFNHSPRSFDAYYALTWGNSCTGHAHAATALLRGMGIPARTKLVMITSYRQIYDMHWNTDYFIPGYGWVAMDTTTGTNPNASTQEVVIYSCEPADEFPLFYDHGIDGFWHTSDPDLGTINPAWNLAHQATGSVVLSVPTEVGEELMGLARTTFDFEVDHVGAVLPPNEMSSLEAGMLDREQATSRLLAYDGVRALDDLRAAAAEFAGVEPRPRVVRYESDFEDGPLGWSHGGPSDQWEFGRPADPGPESARSGVNCWGTVLAGNYESPSDIWLKSPPINLENLVNAQIEFWIWSLTWSTYMAPIDGLWLDITTDGTNYVSLCNVMSGGNDDASIPVVTGWARMDLDLSPYVGQTVQIRFRFQANSGQPRSGVYLDDVKVTGLTEHASAVTDVLPPHVPGAISALAAYPNPFNPKTRITFELSEPRKVLVAVYDMTGNRVAVLADQTFDIGPQGLDWVGRDKSGRPLPSGAYLLRVEASGDSRQLKLLLVR